MTQVLVTGANGRTGRAIVQALARASSPRVPVQVRAFLRDAAQWPAIAALGASEHAIGDMADAASVARALQGCDALVHVGPPMHPDEKAMTANFVAAARQQQLRHFVYYSVLQPLRREVRHHRLKLETEELVVESDLPYTIVQPTRYMQHLENIWKPVTEQGVHGMPFSTRVRFNVADLADLAEATARVVVESAPGAARPGAHFFATYELAGPESLSQEDMARVLSEVLGRPVTARAVPLAEMQAKARTAGLGEDRIEQMTVMNRHYDAHGMRGNPNVLRMLLGREPTPYRQYVERLARR
ncbi:MAG: NAD(P)H-binding protein [Steroidobacteraceae bacterium]|jgi:uncharacterized protein YbjT (DUF2867 family)|nr:NAD(P)H-binding protein [Steroidobacteraceae bacterium]